MSVSPVTHCTRCIQDGVNPPRGATEGSLCKRHALLARAFGRAAASAEEGDMRPMSRLAEERLAEQQRQQMRWGLKDSQSDAFEIDLRKWLAS